MEKRIHGLQQKKPTSATLSEAIPWYVFRPLLEQGYSHKRKSSAVRNRIDPLILFKMLVLQQLFNLSVGIAFRERLRKAGVIDELFERFEEHQRSQRLEARGGQIIDATLVPVPKQLNSQLHLRIRHYPSQH